MHALFPEKLTKCYTAETETSLVKVKKKNKTKPTHSQLHDINDHIPYIHPNEPPPSLTRVVTFNKQKMPSDSFESSHIHIKLLTHCVFNVPLIRLLSDCICPSVLCAEAGLRWGPHAASEQSRRPHRHDDGHSGDGSVSVQRQADGREGPSETSERLRPARSRQTRAAPLGWLPVCLPVCVRRRRSVVEEVESFNVFVASWKENPSVPEGKCESLWSPSRKICQQSQQFTNFFFF